MQLSEYLTLLTCAASAVSCRLVAAQGGFASVPANTSCASASTIPTPARSDIECAVKCQQNDSIQSFSFVNGVCVLSDSPNCAPSSSAMTVFSKQKTASATYLRGYETQVDSRRFWVFQQRCTGTLDFARNWTSYEAGFGQGIDNETTEFWAGLSLIYKFTQARITGNTLRIEMVSVFNIYYYGEWSGVTLSSPSTQYSLAYSANDKSNISGDLLSGNNGYKFSTMDVDNDAGGGSCSTERTNGGFWYGACGDFNPNSQWSPGNSWTSTQSSVLFAFRNAAPGVIAYQTLRWIRMMLLVA